MTAFREKFNPRTGKYEKEKIFLDKKPEIEGECKVCNGTGEVVELRESAYCHCSAGRALEEKMRRIKNEPKISRPPDPNIDDRGTSQFSSKN